MFTGIFSRTQNQLHGHLTEIYLKLVCIYVDMVTSFKASIPRMAMKIQVDPQVTKLLQSFQEIFSNIAKHESEKNSLLFNLTGSQLFKVKNKNVRLSVTNVFKVNIKDTRAKSIQGALIISYLEDSMTN